MNITGCVDRLKMIPYHLKANHTNLDLQLTIPGKRAILLIQHLEVAVIRKQNKNLQKIKMIKGSGYFPRS